MTIALTLGRYAAREAVSPEDRARAFAFRAGMFRAGANDQDAFDAIARHILLEHSGAVIGYFRITCHNPFQKAHSYAARFFDLTKLAGAGPSIEVGRFCLDHISAEPLRLAWAALGQEVDRTQPKLLFGCSSFAGTDPAPYEAAFDHLARHHAAPRALAPGRLDAGSGQGVFALKASPNAKDTMAALRAMPPLLRGYLGLGGWVSDHAVVDPDLGTLAVLTAVEIRNIPAARLASIRALAA